MPSERKILVYVGGIKTSVQDNLLTKKANGDYEKHYNADMSLDVATIEAETLEASMTYFTNEIQKHIDEAMIVFNTTNSVSFESLANIDSASNRVGYSKQAECKAFADWAYITVWDTMRAWQSTLTAIPTEADFRAKLATVAYNV